MAEEPQTENPPLPTAAEQKQEAAALSNLSTQTIDEDPSSSKASKADHAALGAALSHLSVGDQGKDAEGGVKKDVAAVEKKEVKRVKVADEDLRFLVSAVREGRCAVMGDMELMMQID